VAPVFLMVETVPLIMAETDTEYDDPLFDDESVDEEFDRLLGIVFDGVIGAAGGLVGIALMSVVLLIAASVGMFATESFGAITMMLNLQSAVPAVAFGFLVFLATGMGPWPLLFASLKGYLPGESDRTSGLLFATAIWTGFVFSFYEGYTGIELAGYLGFTLLAHWAYGFGLGTVFEYLTNRPDSLV